MPTTTVLAKLALWPWSPPVGHLSDILLAALHAVPGKMDEAEDRCRADEVKARARARQAARNQAELGDEDRHARTPPPSA